MPEAVCKLYYTAGAQARRRRKVPDMRKRERRPRKRPDPDQPLSAGRVEYLEAARARVRSRNFRRTAIIVLVLAAIIAFATGFVGTSVARAKDLVDTIAIAITPDAGWPQNTGVSEVLQAETLSGGFVELGEDSCVVYSNTGNRLNSIQSGYARPALAVGTTRFVLYNRSGNELRVESRTQNLYTKTMENSIYLCAMANDGKLAVVTDAVRSAATLTLYSATMEQQLTWDLTSEEGVPLRLAFSTDSRRLAAAAVTANAGQMVTNLYVLTLNQGDPVLVGTQNGVPQWVGWLTSDTILAVYDSRAVVYYAGGGERAAYDFSGRTLTSISVDPSYGVALLFTSGQVSEAVILDKSLNVQYSGSVPLADRIVRDGQSFYLLTSGGVECFDSAGNYQWEQEFSAQPQALLTSGSQLLVFSGNTVQQIMPPEQDSAS